MSPWSNDLPADDDQRFRFGAPSRDLPDGRLLVGVRTPLGLAQPRWTDSFSMWLDGDGFSKPVGHFDPNALEPVYVSALQDGRPEPLLAKLSQGARISPDGLQTKLDLRMTDYRPSDSVAAELADRFLKENVEHFTLLEDGTPPVRSPPTEQLRNSIHEYARSPIGYKVLDHSVRHGVKQPYLHDPYFSDVAGFDRKRKLDERKGVMIYNPTALDAYNKGLDEGDVDYAPGDAHETADLTTTVAHEFGHTPWGRVALNLPWIPEPLEPRGEPGEIVVRQAGPYDRAEETRATDQFENPYRDWAKKPRRRSYYTPNDVWKWREHVAKVK